MIGVDFSGKAVLVTGATRGLGKAIAEAFTRAGAMVFITHRWGSVPEDALRNEFEEQGLAAPRVLQCDASDLDETRGVMEAIRDAPCTLHAVVSNVAFAQVTRSVDDLRLAPLELSLRYSAWPLLYLVQASHQIFGVYPRYVVGISSDGSAVCHEGYDMAGVAKAALETLCRYLALRLKPHGVRVNVVRPGLLDTASLRATFGEGLVRAACRRASNLLLDPYRVAEACVALCSGMMDAVTGQIIVADEGWSLVSPLTHLLAAEERERGGADA